MPILPVLKGETMKIMLSKKHITAIAKAIAAGCPMETAALQAGICRRTLYQWRKTGKQASRGIFFELNTAIEKADATFIKRSLALISAHGRENWQAIAWLLERRHPELFGRYDRMQAQQMKEIAAELKLLRGELANRQTT
jgi:transposase-like protein